MHFKRIGTSQSFQLVGHNIEGFHAEWRQGTRGVLILQEYDGHVIKRKEGIQINGEDFSTVQSAIQAFTSQPLALQGCIESYFISARDCPSDRDFINEHDVTGMTVREVIWKTGINLVEYFEEWNGREGTLPVVRILQAPPDSVLEMCFDELHDLIHWNNHKQDYVKLFMAGIGKE